MGFHVVGRVLTHFLLPLVLWSYETSTEIFLQQGAPQVKLSENAGLTGFVEFSRNGQPYSSFTGIQYATIAERFEPSELVTDPTWTGFKNSTQPGPMCPQKPLIEDFITGDELNCLNLNVHVPTTTKVGDGKYPVMVWVHGGGLQFGAGSSYGAKFFMDEDVILVTINFRLGVFGFLSTGDEVIPGNNGVKDMVVALQWVQQNIEKFGGDPNSVTVFGVSGGGAGTHHLLLSPTTKGLMHRLISESASALSTWGFQPNPRKMAIDLSTYLKCPTNAADQSEIRSEEILTCLKETSVDELNRAQIHFAPFWPTSVEPMVFMPVAEPIPSANSKNKPFLTATPLEILTSSNHEIQDIPWLTGITTDEGFNIAPFLAEDFSQLEKDFQELAPISMAYDRYFASKEEIDLVSQKLRDFYMKGKPVNVESRFNVNEMYGDAMFAFGIRKSAIHTAAKGNKVYLYEFEQYMYGGEANDTSFQEMVKSFNPQGDELTGHGNEVWALFDRTGFFPPEFDSKLIQPGSDVEKFSQELVKLWASFAKHGEPTHTWGNNQKWTPLPKNAGESGKINFYKIDKIGTRFVEESFPERMQFWEKLWQEHFTEGALGKHAKKVNSKTEL